MSENVKFALQTTLVMSIIICLLVFFKSDRKLYLKPYFMLSQIYASIGSFLPQPLKQRSLDYQNLLQLL